MLWEKAQNTSPKRGGQLQGTAAGVLPGGKPILKQLQDSKSQNRPVCPRLEKMKGLTKQKEPPASRSPPLLSMPHLLHSPAFWSRVNPPPPVPGFIPDYPTPRPLWLGWLRPAARDLSGTHNHPLPSWGPSGKACPPRQQRICPSLAGPELRPGWGAQEGAAGAGPDYL